MAVVHGRRGIVPMLRSLSALVPGGCLVRVGSGGRRRVVGAVELAVVAGAAVAVVGGTRWSGWGLATVELAVVARAAVRAGVVWGARGSQRRRAAVELAVVAGAAVAVGRGTGRLGWGVVGVEHAVVAGARVGPCPAAPGGGAGILGRGAAGTGPAVAEAASTATGRPVVDVHGGLLDRADHRVRDGRRRGPEP
jgi:hypothetical protein